ncbi:Pentatricopeptide repeat-containing protein [Nymphaea thermarum]|nr:Pentatricopeptide repeat-containing protein [Nymphaea thermarum]
MPLCLYQLGYLLSLKNRSRITSFGVLNLVSRRFGHHGHVVKDDLTGRLLALLEICRQSQDIESLRQTHAHACVHGLSNDNLLGTKILGSYANYGYVDEARRVFDLISHRDSHPWDTAILGYFRKGFFQEVLGLYSGMKEEVGIGSFACTFAFKSCAELGCLKVARGIHGDSLKLGFDKDRFVGASLINCYMNCRFLYDAQKVFDAISHRDVVICTAMISGFLQNSEEHGAWMAFRIAFDMQTEGILPNRVTLMSLLKAASRLESLSIGKSIHCYAIRMGRDTDDGVFETCLIEMYMSCGAEDISRYLFANAKTKSVVTWNVMITSYIQCGRPSDAFEVFHLMKNEGNVSPDAITLSNLVLGCTHLKCIREGLSIHGYIIRRGVLLDLVGNTALIEMYALSKGISIARKMFDEMETRDAVLFNVMLAAYLRFMLVDEAFSLFTTMGSIGVKPNVVTVLNLLSGCLVLPNLQEGSQIHGMTIKCGYDLDTAVTNQIINLYAKHGHLADARALFNRMSPKDLISWTSMMMGYVNQGHAGEALNLFSVMHGTGQKPDAVALSTLLIACSQLGYLNQLRAVHGYLYHFCLEKDVPIINYLIAAYSKWGLFNHAQALFQNMIDRSLASWNTMIDACGMHGRCMEALELFDEMQREKVEPDGVTFTSLLAACSHAGRIEEGLHLFRSMIDDRLIIPREEHYSCMVDLLSRAGQLEEAYNLTKCFPFKGNASTLGPLLGACMVHQHSELGETIGTHLLSLDPENTGAYTLMSNMYAGAGRWDDAQRVRDAAKARGLKKLPGYSLVGAAKRR